MKKICLSIAFMVCSVFAGTIFNADGSVNKESVEYKKANEECFNGCDYDDWNVSQTLQYSLDGSEGSYRDFSEESQLSEEHPLYIGFSTNVTTDHWSEKTQPSIPVVLKITAENGFKYYMITEGNGSFAWIKNEYEGIYKFHAVGNKKGKRNFAILKLSSIKSGSVSVQVIYLNESLNRRYGTKRSLYIRPKK